MSTRASAIKSKRPSLAVKHNNNEIMCKRESATIAVVEDLYDADAENSVALLDDSAAYGESGEKGKGVNPSTRRSLE